MSEDDIWLIATFAWSYLVLFTILIITRHNRRRK